MLPVLIAIVMGCVDVGRGIHTRIALTNAVREGALYGATTGFTDYTETTWKTEVRERVTDEMSNVNGFVSGDLTVNVETSEYEDEVCLKVIGNYKFETVIHWPGFPREIDLRHEIELQRYR